MSLDFSFKKIANYKEACYGPALEKDEPTRGLSKGDRPIDGTLHTLIWATLAVGLGTITEKNVDEWRFRIAALDVVGANPFWRFADDVGVKSIHGIESYVPERDEIARFIGLETNAFPEKTRKQWLASVIVESVERRAKEMIR